MNAERKFWNLIGEAAQTAIDDEKLRNKIKRKVRSAVLAVALGGTLLGIGSPNPAEVGDQVITVPFSSYSGGS